jgi:hypothetical protein
MRRPSIGEVLHTVVEYLTPQMGSFAPGCRLEIVAMRPQPAWIPPQWVECKEGEGNR